MNKVKTVKNLTVITCLLIFLTGCQKNYIEIQRFDKFVSLVKDEQGKIYVKSKNTAGDCDGYSYNDVATIYIIDYEHHENSLSTILDVQSVKFIGNQQSQYYFDDKNNSYLVLAHICDNVVTYRERKSSEI